MEDEDVLTRQSILEQGIINQPSPELSQLRVSMIVQLVNNNKFLAAAFIAEVSSCYVMNQRTRDVESYSIGPPPDLWFGFTERKLYNYMDSLGQEGRNAYLVMNNADLCHYMWCYMVLLGSLLLRRCLQTNTTPAIALIFPFTMCMDFVESIYFRYATVYFPLHLSNKLVLLASFANQMKWFGFAIGLGTLAVTLMLNPLAATHSKAC